MSEEASGAKAPIKIKKYANRRLYNTATSSYVTLDHLCQMVKDDVDFVVTTLRAAIVQARAEAEAEGIV